MCLIAGLSCIKKYMKQYSEPKETDKLVSRGRDFNLLLGNLYNSQTKSY